MFFLLLVYSQFFLKIEKTAIFKIVRDKSKYFAIENQKNAIFLKLADYPV